MDLKDDEGDDQENGLSEKEAEIRFLAWYSDVCEERMTMLEAEEGYKRRVKELETGLSDLLEGFEQAEKEINYLRHKYEPKDASDLYLDPYDVVCKERDKLRDSEKRNKELMERLENENVFLRNRLTRIEDGNFGDKINGEQFNHESSLGVMLNDISESVKTSGVPVEHTNTSIKRENDIRLHSPNADSVANDIALYSATYRTKENGQDIQVNSVTTSRNDGSEIVLYTKKNILSYRKEIQTLLIAKTEYTQAKASVINNTFKQPLSRAKRCHEVDSTYAKYFDKMKTAKKTTGDSTDNSCTTNTVQPNYPKALVVVTSSERMEKMEIENRELKNKIRDLECERTGLLEHMANLHLHMTPSKGSRNRFNSQKSDGVKGNNIISRFPRLKQTDKSLTASELSRKSSRESFASTDIPSPINSVDPRQVNKIPSRTSLFSDGYVSIFKAKRHNTS